jgi:hypothetical protein
VQAARTATLLLITAVLALGMAACGGAEVSYEEVPGPPASVPIPDDQTSLEGGGAAEDGADAGADATPTPDADGAAAPEDQSGAAGTDQAATTEPAPAATADPGTTDTGGGTTAPAEPDGPANDTAPPEGSEAQQFEDFCAQNPGAC